MMRIRSHLDVLFPKVRAEVLRALYSTPAKGRYVRELAALTGLALSTIQDELRKLVVLGVLISWQDRKRRFYGANRAYPLFSELKQIVKVSERLPPVRHSHLQRPRHGRFQQRKRRKLAHLPVRREPHWDLFTKQDQSTA
jgi:predicted transcriptional regulator